MGITPSPSSLPPPTPPGPPTLILKPRTAWGDAWRRCRDAAPEAFTVDGALRGLRCGGWHDGGEVPPATSPLDGTALAGLPAAGTGAAREALAAAAGRHRAWCHVPAAERRDRVAAALDALAEHRTLLALLLVWETGSPWKHARTGVDGAVDDVRRHLDTAGPLQGRTAQPGPVAAADGGRRPMTLVHAMLLQALAGNAVIAEPREGVGAACLGLACALSVREGLPFTLLSGADRATAVGEHRDGQGAEGHIARHSLEQRGPDCWGVWDSSDREALTPLIRGLFGRTGQRSGTGSRFVVRRSLLDAFLEAYLPAVRSARYGHPLAVAGPEHPLPDLDFGPLSSAAEAEGLSALVRDAVGRGAEVLHQGSLADGHFLPGQDTSAYLAPVALLCPPSLSRSAPWSGGGPYGPVDWIVPVETEAELLAEMNANANAGDQAGGRARGRAGGRAGVRAALRTGDRDGFGRHGPSPLVGSDERSRSEAPVGRVRLTCAGARAGKKGDPNRRRPDQPPERAARWRPRRAARSPGNSEVKSAAGAWYGCARRHGQAGRRPLSGWRNGRRASLRC